MLTYWHSCQLSHESYTSVQWLGNAGFTLLPSFLGIVVIHDRDTYQPTSLSIMWWDGGIFRCSVWLCRRMPVDSWQGSNAQNVMIYISWWYPRLTPRSHVFLVNGNYNKLYRNRTFFSLHWKPHDPVAKTLAKNRWMAYGRLIDPENEFFIQRCDGQSLQTEGSHGEVSVPRVARAHWRDWCCFSPRARWGFDLITLPPTPRPSFRLSVRTSTASSRSQWALPDLNRELQISVCTAGPQPRAPDLSGHCRTSTASSRSQWALPEYVRI